MNTSLNLIKVKIKMKKFFLLITIWILSSLISFFTSCQVCYALIKINLNKSFISAGETIKVDVTTKTQTEKDLYIAIITPNQNFFSVVSGKIIPGLQAYGRFTNFQKTIINLRLDQISSELAGEYIIAVATIPPGQNIWKYPFKEDELKFVKVRLRESIPRNIDYLRGYLQHIKNKDKAYLYALYGARLLSVPQIELYLQADDLFIKTILNTPGTSAWFLKNPAEIMPDIMPHFEDSSPFGMGNSFSFDLLNLEDYQAVNEYEVYPTKVPFLNWLDRRFQPIQFTLKAQKKFGAKITFLEKTVLLYFKSKYQESFDNKKMFILYCKNGKSYLAKGSKFYNWDGIETNLENFASEVVIIFNENSVWYPLMDRDDSYKDPNLYSLLEEINNVKAQIGENTENLNIFLEPSEEEFIIAIKNNVSFTNDKQIELLKMIAESGDWGLAENMYSVIPENLKRIRGFSYRQVSLYNTNHVRLIASFLSPIADYLANVLVNHGYFSMSQEFLKFNKWGGETWLCCYTSYTIDQGFRLDIGTCKDLSIYAAAILQIAGKNWIRLHGDWIGYEGFIHFYVYVPEDGIFIDNGHSIKWQTLHSKYVMIGSPYSGSADYSHIDIITTENGFAQFFFMQDENDDIIGTLPKYEVIRLLNIIFQNAEPSASFVLFDENYRSLAEMDYSEGINRIKSKYIEVEFP